MSWDELGQVGTSWNELERVGISWEPEKLQNFTLKKTSGEERKKERKKKNIGYRVASNERRLIMPYNYLSFEIYF